MKTATPRIHRGFSDSAEAYDCSQCDESIHDGDILVAGRSVAILVEAWPTLVKGPAGEFHRNAFGEPLTEAEWLNLEDGKYALSYKIAAELPV
jgi:hypothetical protein